VTAEVTLAIDIPGRASLALEHLLLDQNGTLTNRGQLIEGVASRIARVRERLQVHVLSADTFGTFDALVRELGVDGQRISSGAEKRAFMRALGPARCAAIGNGTNDVSMLNAAALGITVIGPEGASGAAIAAADVVCGSVLDALELLLDERALVATLRV
jgi:soluble P-type ATPase